MIARSAVVVLLSMLVAGCGRLIPSAGAAPARDAWARTLTAAQQAADSGRPAAADQRLADFAAAYPGSAEARESLYWRGVLRLADPADTAATRLGLAVLKQYVATDGGAQRRAAQALVVLAESRAELQRQAAVQEREIAQIRTALGRAQEARPTTGGDDRSDRNLAGEVERLKAELSRANQELERVRRRLAGQRP